MKPEPNPFVRRVTTPLVAISALFVLAGGYIHLREWLDTYRAVPASLPGAEVVRIGFPLNAGTSVLVATALVVTAIVWPQLVPKAVLAALVFEVSSLAALILSRTGSLAGWMEPVWNSGASQARAVEVAAIVALLALAAVLAAQNRAYSRLVAAPTLVD